MPTASLSAGSLELPTAGRLSAPMAHASTRSVLLEMLLYHNKAAYFRLAEYAKSHTLKTNSRRAAGITGELPRDLKDRIGQQIARAATGRNELPYAGG